MAASRFVYAIWALVFTVVCPAKPGSPFDSLRPSHGATAGATRVAQAGSANDRQAVQAISDAISVFESQYVDVPDWPGILFAALEGLTAAEHAFDVVIAAGPQVTFVHRGDATGQKTLSIDVTEKSSKDEVRRQLLAVMEFAHQSANLGRNAISEDFINGLSRLSGPRVNNNVTTQDVLDRMADRTNSIAEVVHLGGGIEYLRIDKFRLESANDVVRTLNEIGPTKVVGIVLDLRGNSGGPLESAVDVAGLFLDAGAVVASSKGRDRRHNQQMKGKKGGAFAHVPVALLVDSATAAGAELVVGALRDGRQAPVIGEKTKGDGLLIGIYRLSNGSRLLIRVARWFTPRGTPVDGAGLTPDIEIRSISSVDRSKVDPSNDVQLAGAIGALDRIVNGRKP